MGNEMDNKRIEDKLMWMNVDPWDSYRWLAEHICKLEDENVALRKDVAKFSSTNSQIAEQMEQWSHEDVPVDVPLLRSRIVDWARQLQIISKNKGEG